MRLDNRKSIIREEVETLVKITSSQNTLFINSSGHSGREGAHGYSGSRGGNCSPGSDGYPGERGQDGQHAEDVSLHLSVNEITNNVDINVISRGHYPLPLGNPDTEILIHAHGGHGGKGGDGGQGGEGGRGCDGRNASQYSYGTSGEDGSPGGDGGCGGNGGDGGDAGHVKIRVKKQDTDLLMLLAQPSLSGGTGGGSGEGGRGGNGGAGGRGGNSHFWTEEIHHHCGPDDHSQDHIDYVYHSNPGGRDGNDGRNGRWGHSGQSGNHGRLGRFEIEVEKDNIYPGRYDLSLASLSPVESDDGIIEPGESLAVQDLVFKNMGAMPTPAYQGILVSLTPNQWIDFENQNTLALDTAIPSSHTAMLKNPLHFQVKEAQSIPAVDSTFHETGHLQFKATVSRVNKSFKTVANQIQFLSIRYPVEISTVSLPPSISREEEAPFIFKIRNISKKAIGFNANDARLLKVDLSLTGGVDGALLEFHDSQGQPLQTLDSPLAQQIACLNPGEEVYFAGTLGFNGDTPSYTQADLTCQLHIGHLKNKLSDIDTIQQRNFKVQLADSFQYHPEADLVLVTNNETDSETIKSWAETAARLGTSISIWNTSLYSGVSYTQRREDEGSFIEQMQGKVMVILNNEMTLKDHQARSTDCLDAMEILSAAKNANVSTYVIGQHFDIKKAVSPLTHVSQNDHTTVVQDKFLFWRRPNTQHLQKKARELSQRLQKENPHQRYQPFYQFQAKKKQTGCFSLRPTWELGEVDMRETLDSAQPHIAFRKANSEDMREPADVDIYDIVKLLPFTKKLRYLEEAKDAHYAQIIKNAILSDLADELLIYAKYKWNGHFSREKLSQGLMNLKTLSEHRFSDQTHVGDILLSYEYFANRLPTITDKYFFPFLCLRTRLKQFSHEKTRQMLTHYFPHDNLATERKSVSKKWDSLSREQLFEQFSAPYKNQVVFDNQVSLEEPILKDELLRYEARESRFVEKHHFFASSHARKESIESYKANCKFN